MCGCMYARGVQYVRLSIWLSFFCCHIRRDTISIRNHLAQSVRRIQCAYHRTLIFVVWHVFPLHTRR